jgi:general stress protein CsbA
MLFRILSEVFVGLLVAGIVTAVLVPATMQLGYEPRPWMAWVAVAGSVAACIAIGERKTRQKARSSS